MIRYFDLTHPVNNQLPSYPGDPPCTISQLSSVTEDTYSNYLLEMGAHAGTHIETPAHVKEEGKFLADYPLERFEGRGVLVDAQEKKLISSSVLKGVPLQRGDIVLLRTGHGSLFGKPEYFTSHPVIRKDFAEALIASRVSVLALDTPSPDGASLQIHQLLLGNDVLLIENVARLERFPFRDNFSVTAFPLHVHIDASPIRLVARSHES